MEPVHLTTFDPYKIPYQARVLELLRKKWDWNSGSYPEILLSGGYGSAKSTLLAHLAVTHCLFNRRALVAVCRRTLPDLKRTLIQEIIDHLSPLTPGKHYIYNKSSQMIWFPHTDSRIGPVTWADKQYKKIRSLKLSGVIIEEGAENNEDDFEAFLELKARLRRRPVIKENFLVVATNPDSPDHWLYRYFIEPQPHPTRFVFYSKPEDNPFLPPGYVEQLRKDLDPISARRYLDGEWIGRDNNAIYYCFSEKENVTEKVELLPHLPLDISFDFNIGIGKPMSVTIGQYDERMDLFRVIDSVTIQSLATQDMMQELEGRGCLEPKNGGRVHVRVFGDATGAARSTKSLHSDYDIIASYLGRLSHKVTFELCVPRSNPPIKERHNIVNSYLLNAQGRRRVLIGSNAKMLIRGLRLTALKDGASYVEDDSKDYQHITTALGYWICYLHNQKGASPLRSVTL